MLIATLPTFVSDDSLTLSERILGHRVIEAVRYNTGGASPYSPKEIVEKLINLRRYGKKIYIDLEGRQMRIARWVPFHACSVTLNKDFEIELPGKIYFRGLGWFKILNTKNRKIFFEYGHAPTRYYFGESQSVHIIAKNFQIKGYLGGLDLEFINAAVKAGINTFMLSFVESYDDLIEFFGACNLKGIGPPEVIIKIESLKGIDFVKKLQPTFLNGLQLMAARDDLFLSHVNNLKDFIDSLKIIIAKDPNAILASKIMSGLEKGADLTMGDLADMFLMSKFGYRNYMFSDELSKNFEQFDWAINSWWYTIAPLIRKATNA